MGSGRNIDETTLPTYDDETSGRKTVRGQIDATRVRF